MGNLDLVCFRIKIVSMAERAFVAKEDAGPGMNIDLSVTFVTRKSIDATTKDTQKRDIGTLILADLKWRLVARAMRDHIMDHEVVAKGIRPELCREISRKKHSADSVSNGTMGAFDSSILKGGSRTGDLYGITCAFEEVVNLSASAKLAALIEADTTIGYIRGVPRDEFLNEVNGGTLITTNGTAKCTAMATRDKNIACFTIETSKTFETFDGFIGFAGCCRSIDRRDIKGTVAACLNLGVKVENKILWRRKCSLSDEVPVCVTKKILPGGVLDNLRRTILESCSVGDPR